MLHDIFNIAMQNVAESVDRIGFYVAVLFQPVDLGTIHIMMRIKIILRDPLFFHCLPQSVVFYHRTLTLIFLLTIFSMAIK